MQRLSQMPYIYLGYSPPYPHFGGQFPYGRIWFKGQVQIANWGSWIFRSMSGDPLEPFVAIELGSPDWAGPDVSWSFYDPADDPANQPTKPRGGRGAGSGGTPPLSVAIEISVTLPGSTGAQVVQEIIITESLPAGVW
jgi:hypothetical protein